MSNNSKKLANIVLGVCFATNIIVVLVTGTMEKIAAGGWILATVSIISFIVYSISMEYTLWDMVLNLLIAAFAIVALTLIVNSAMAVPMRGDLTYLWTSLRLGAMILPILYFIEVANHHEKE